MNTDMNPIVLLEAENISRRIGKVRYVACPDTHSTNKDDVVFMKMIDQPEVVVAGTDPR